MDYDISLMEERIREKWKKNKISKPVNAHSNGIIFSIDTPPPTVSGEIHIGHAFSYPHQDMIARFKRMKGYKVIYPFGYDNNGLATERYVEKIRKVSLTNMDRKEAIKTCEETSKIAMGEMRNAMEKLAISADFDIAYVTYSREVWKISQAFFLDLLRNNIAYRSEGMTIACPTCRTAISQIEMEDRELETDFVTLRFNGEDGSTIDIATTRPEMLAACVAIAINPKDPRAMYLSKRKFIVPIYGQAIGVIQDERVLMDKGTGTEMVCTFGDQTDYEIWKEHNLPLTKLLDSRGFIRDNSHLEGLKPEEGRKKIKGILKEKGFVIETKRIKHSVNTHERCGTPIEIGVSKQWYLRYMDKKEELLEIGREIKWTPDYMRVRYENWVKGLKWDWCISRQRIMGIPIPVWYCHECGTINTPDADKIPVDPRFESLLKCKKCGSKDLESETDVLDTWFTSSISPSIISNAYGMDENFIPMNVRFQGHDIISTWAFTTIYRSMIHFQKIPWDRIVISGNVFDSRGQKMSKSKGNAVDPMEMVKKYGADGVRLWDTSVTTWDDISLKEQELVRGRRTIIKLYNAVSLVSGIEKSQEKKVTLPFNKWILESSNRTIKKASDAYENFDIAKARIEIDQLFWGDFCDNYLEMIKPYISSGNAQEREEISWVSRRVITDILKLYAPITPYITEECFGMLGNQGLIVNETWPEPEEKNQDIMGEFAAVLELISALRKAKSSAKSSKTSYTGFLVTCKTDLNEKYEEIIRKTLREDNVKFVRGEQNEAVVISN